MDPSWTTEQRNAHTTARDWVRQQLLPWAVADTYATWFATVGRNLFEEQEEAFRERFLSTPEVRHRHARIYRVRAHARRSERTANGR